jgi:hypothetical protein
MLREVLGILAVPFVPVTAQSMGNDSDIVHLIGQIVLLLVAFFGGRRRKDR